MAFAFPMSLKCAFGQHTLVLANITVMKNVEKEDRIRLLNNSLMYDCFQLGCLI